MEIKEIKVSKTAGPVVLTVTSNRPLGLGGNVWRYNADKTPDLKAGTFTTDKPNVQLGAPEALDGKFIYAKGVVLHFNDNPPVRYEVALSVMQGSTTLLSGVPEGWTGQIGSSDIGIGFIFQIKVA